MKKRIAVVCFLLVSVLAVTGAYYVFDRIFPKSDSIIIPEIENIISATVSDNSNNEAEITETELGEIVSGVAEAKPTRKQSVNDYPAVNPHYEIEIQTNDRLYSYFVYEEDGVYYVELPYAGVWRTDSELYGAVSMLF